VKSATASPVLPRRASISPRPCQPARSRLERISSPMSASAGSRLAEARLQPRAIAEALGELAITATRYSDLERRLELPSRSKHARDRRSGAAPPWPERMAFERAFQRAHHLVRARERRCGAQGSKAGCALADVARQSDEYHRRGSGYFFCET